MTTDGQAKAQTSLADLGSDWLDRIHVGDCVSVLDRWVGDHVVDMIFADPPYNIGYSYDIYNDARPDEEYLTWLRQWISRCTALLAEHGSFWIAIGDEYAAEVKWIATREIGLVLRNWVVWYYTFGVHCQSKFTRSHTHLLHLVKNPDRAIFHADAVRVPSARRLIYHDLRADPKGRVPDNTWILRPQQIPHAFRPDEDTWYVPRVAGTFSERARFHGCQLPERLVARAILACTDEGHVVLDPFAGSGTTLAVAKKLGRRWVGIELSANYAAHAERRVRAVRRGDPLEGPEEAVMPVQRRRCAVSRRPLLEAKCRVREMLGELVRDSSVERCLTDPVHNAVFLERCRHAMLPGRPFDWNSVLLSEAMGRALPLEELLDDLADVPAMAADLAAGRLLAQGYPDVRTLLCEPRVSCLFDELAQELCPGTAAARLRRCLLSALRLTQLAGKITARSDPGELALEPLASARRAPVAAGIVAIGSRNKRRDAVVWHLALTRDLARAVQWCRESLATLQAIAPVPGEIVVGWQPLAGEPADQRWARLWTLLEQTRPWLSALWRESNQADTH